MLVERGEDVNTTNDKTETALHGAAYRGANSRCIATVGHGSTSRTRWAAFGDDRGGARGPVLSGTRRDRGVAARADERPAATDLAGRPVRKWRRALKEVA